MVLKLNSGDVRFVCLEAQTLAEKQSTFKVFLITQIGQRPGARARITIRLKRLKPRAPKILGIRTISRTSVSNYICTFVLGQRTFFYDAANKRSLQKNEREALK